MIGARGIPSVLVLIFNLDLTEGPIVKLLQMVGQMPNK